MIILQEVAADGSKTLVEETTETKVVVNATTVVETTTTVTSKVVNATTQEMVVAIIETLVELRSVINTDE